MEEFRSVAINFMVIVFIAHILTSAFIHFSPQKMRNYIKYAYHIFLMIVTILFLYQIVNTYTQKQQNIIDDNTVITPSKNITRPGNYTSDIQIRRNLEQQTSHLSEKFTKENEEAIKKFNNL